ncbi:MAG: hypothetical protein U9R79_07440 [Armatimonadota bacterium]|nr:hypothetical protein [Armatimonadota bacterium]
MKLDLLDRLLTEEEPLVPPFEELRGLWSVESFREYQQAGDLQAYLSDNEHRASAFEREIWDVYADVYQVLEGEHPRKQFVSEVLQQDEFTLVVFDGLSLREVPCLLQVMEERDIEAEVDFALAPVPTETSVFAQEHFGASGPSGIQSGAELAFEHVKQTTWEPSFGREQRRRLIWAPHPDNIFTLNSDTVEYGGHVVEPVQAILAAILDSDPVLPLYITSDHGYLWQGGACAWALDDDDEEALLAREFKAGRSADDPTAELTSGEKVWSDAERQVAAARGRFAWGGRVTGPPRNFKHGGVSLVECLVPALRLSGEP